MKKLLTILLLISAFGLSAQAKQDRVMLQQIVLLKTYGGYLQKGYRIAKDGLSFIGRMKSGELNLHTFFFEGLQLVNPRLRDYENVHTIIRLNSQIAAVKESLEEQLAHDLLYANEKQYLLRVLERVVEDTADDLEALYDVLTDDTITADDAQRIEWIDGLAEEMEERYVFIRSFSDKTRILIIGRNQEQKETERSRELYNLNTAP
jgi:hypothetical protein